MKILILTEGGKSIGFGHIARCVSLSQAFEERGMQPELLINGDSTVETILKNRKYRIFDWLKEKEDFFMLVKDAHIIIVDSYLAGYKFYKKIAKVATITAYLDDNKRLKYPKGVVINGNIYAGNINYPKTDGITYLCGIQFALLRKEFQNIPKKNIKENIKSIVITFGGYDKRNMTEKILKFINEEYPRFTKNVIINTNFQKIKEIEALKDRKTNLVYNPDTEKLKKIIIKSDIAISAGGQTLNELARLGIPTICICVAENQLQHIIEWERIKFLEYIGWYNDTNLTQKIKNLLFYLENKLVRKNKSEIGQKNIDGKGNRRITNFLLKDYFTNLRTNKI